MNESKPTFVSALKSLSTRDICFIAAGGLIAYLVTYL